MNFRQIPDWNYVLLELVQNLTEMLRSIINSLVVCQSLRQTSSLTKSSKGFMKATSVKFEALTVGRFDNNKRHFGSNSEINSNIIM